ncbi:hypothetical protein SAMN05446589_9208 [Streptomyces sp. OV198]|nr:hypothetical protein [Streptomyces sp. OV198]SOF02119.1 hypothetical protein SAMN05446589_9208 [Streptomyces sp. OV198]
MRWAARLMPYGHDTLTYGCSHPGPSRRPAATAGETKVLTSDVAGPLV